jgi:hypothetical protein
MVSGYFPTHLENKRGYYGACLHESLTPFAVASRRFLSGLTNSRNPVVPSSRFASILVTPHVLATSSSTRATPGSEGGATENPSLMESSSEPESLPPLRTDQTVDAMIRKGLERVCLHTAVGYIVGGLVGLVFVSLSKRSFKHSYRTSILRYCLTGLGAGVGGGTAWTRASIEIEELLTASSTSSSSSHSRNK